ncbi:MAG: condensation domain-containing protein [Patulibacter minatonensis]
MRLTNVAQMDLVAGSVHSYAVRVAPGRDRRRPVSFDQGRHVGEGPRPGSWMAIAFRLTAPATHAELAAAWDAVVARHGTLRTVFSRADGGELELHEVAVESGTWTEHEVAEGRLTRDVLREVFDEHCQPYARPSHRLVVVQPPAGADDPRPEFVIGSDHSHVDMWSLVVLVRDLVTCLDDLRAGRPLGADLPEAPSFAEHTSELEAMAFAPPEIHERWASILDAGGGAMPAFPLPLGELDPVPAEVVEVRDVLDAAETEHLAGIARARGVRLLALGVSVLTEVTAQLAGGQPMRAVFPVHSRHDERWREAVGWFITNAVIESIDPDPVACTAAVREATGLGSWPLAPILAPYGGMPPRPGLFALSWLDVRRLPVPAAEATDLRYVSAAIRTDGVMIWFLVNSSGLHLRCRYPDTPEARANVGRWLDAVHHGIRALAAGR